MSVNTANEYTSFMYEVNEVEKTLGQTTFSVQEVMFLMEMTNFQQSDDKVHKKIWASMEEMLDAAGDDDIINEIRKKNIRIFKAQGKHTKFHAFKTHISGKKMPDCIGCPVHCVNFDGSWRDIDPCVIHAAKASKTRALMTGVESGDYLDSEGNIVSVDKLRLRLNIRIRKKLLELSSPDLNVRRERTIKSSILDRSVQGFFAFCTLCTLLYHCTRVGECRTKYT
jgi:hypothetical protein